MEEIRLNLAERSYSILVGSGLLEQAGSLMVERGLAGRVMIVTNPTIAQWYLKSVQQSLEKAGFHSEAVMVPDGEIYKSLEQADTLYNALIEGHYDRKSILVALGGGVIGDLTGFVAATYLRGVRFVQIPTTLLAHVDSSIGGKVAVNHPRGKNLIGAFHQPSLVISDVNTFRTLPERELSSGMAEVVKHGIIQDDHYFHFISGEIQSIQAVDPGIMTWVVTGSCKIKSHVVEEDERESGMRAILNFGHTIGHALESITNYSRYQHGEAVALGMIGATAIAGELGMVETGDLMMELTHICQQLQLPVSLTGGLKVRDIYEAIYLDKKVSGGKIHWVLPRGLGETVISADVPQTVVEKVLVKMGAV